MTSVEASKTLARGGQVDRGRSGQVEVERVEQVDGRARGVDRHLGRDLQQRLGVVEDDLHARRRPAGRRAPGRRRSGPRGRRRRCPPPRRPARARRGGGRARPPTFVADLGRVGVEDRDDAEAVVGEDVRGGDRLAEVAGAEQRDVVLPGGAQDLADLRDQRVDVVAHAALAELAEAREVAADLGGVDVRVVGELLGGDRLLAHLAGLGQDLQVAREPRGHAEREALAGPSVRRPVVRRRRLAEAHRPRDCTEAQPREQLGLVHEEVEQLLAVERDHRDPLEVAACRARRRPRCRPPRARTAARRGPARAIARASSHRWQPGGRRGHDARAHSGARRWRRRRGPR